MALLCAAWTLHYWHRPIVKASQPIFLLLICGGIILQIFTIIPLSQDTQVEASSNDNACRWMVPLFSFGFCFTFASLFAKQFRVYIVFRRAAKMQHATQKGQFFFFRVGNLFFSHLTCFFTLPSLCADTTLGLTLGIVFLFVFINALLIIVWDVTAPMHWVVVPLKRDQFNLVVSSIGQCQSSSFTLFSILLMVFLFSLILVGNLISCLTKNLPSKFQEAKWIAYSMISSFQVFAIGLPLMLLTGGDSSSSSESSSGSSSSVSTSAAFATRSTFIILNNLGVLAFIFGPKMFNLYKVEEHFIFASLLRSCYCCWDRKQIRATRKQYGSSAVGGYSGTSTTSHAGNSSADTVKMVSSSVETTETISSNTNGKKRTEQSSANVANVATVEDGLESAKYVSAYDDEENAIHTKEGEGLVVVRGKEKDAMARRKTTL